MSGPQPFTHNERLARAHAADALWQGLETWAAAHGWEIHTTLDDLLE